MIQDDDYRFVADLVLKASGIDLGDSGQYLVEARIGTLAREMGFPSLETLLARAKGAGIASDLCVRVIEAMTTNESHFFRDSAPFEILRTKILPVLRETRKATKTIRIWSAACSTGQEPYSIAMVLLECDYLFPDWRIDIAAADLSAKVIDRAKKGVYSTFEVNRGLPREYLLKYFSETPEGYAVRENVKRRVSFSQVNLIEPVRSVGAFDIIFCRNVLIYFNTDLKRKVLEELAKVMAPDGYLFLGGAESATGITSRLERVKFEDGVIFMRADAIDKRVA